MLEQGQIIDDKYRIVGLIGVGGMGAVYEGENERIQRRVAIKVLHADTALNSQAVERFEREAQAAGRIGSDHILEVIDLGKLPNGDHYMVMEFLDGETLGARIKRLGGLSPQQTVPIIRQSLLGLRAAHAAGIVHRDLKPENIFVCKEKAGQHDFVKIIDFGVSKFSRLGTDMSMTRTGAVMGTPYYMSPEQARGSRDLDQRSDLYSMGVILYESVAGHVPFDAETFNELLFKIVLSEPPPLRQVKPDVDPAFESITLKAMARDAAHRFQTADDFVAALDRWMTQGTAVTIPPEVGVGVPGIGGTALMPQVPEPAAVPVIEAPIPPDFTGPAATGGAWANTQPANGSSKKGALIAVAAGVALVVLIGGATAAWRIRASHQAEEAAAALSADVPEVPEVPTQPETPPTPSEVAETPDTSEPAGSASPEPSASAPKDEPKVIVGKPANGTKPVGTKTITGSTPPPKPSAKPPPTSKPPDWGY